MGTNLILTYSCAHAAKAMEGMVNVKAYKHSKEPELYYYFNSKNEKLWMFRHKYYDNLGKRKEKKKSGFKTDKAALKALLEVKAQTLRGQTKQIENENITINKWLDIWFESNKNGWSPRTQEQREIAIRLQMKPLLGQFKLQHLTKDIYQKHYIEELEKKYSPSMVRLLHRLFKIAINAAVDDEILTKNPIKKVTFTKEELKNENFLSPEQLEKFLDDAKQNESLTMYNFLLMVAYTGMRCGEACGLQWKDIDFTNNTITIERSRGNLGVGKTKTKNSIRTIRVDHDVMSQLERYKKWCKEQLLSFGQKLKDDTFVFISQYTVEPIAQSLTSVVVRRIIQRTKLPKVTMHGLRHTHATILLKEKIPVKVIAERLGNTPQMIHTVYGHVLKEMEEESVIAFSQSLKSVGAKIGAGS